MTTAKHKTLTALDAVVGIGQGRYGSKWQTAVALALRYAIYPFVQCGSLCE